MASQSLPNPSSAQRSSAVFSSPISSSSAQRSSAVFSSPISSSSSTSSSSVSQRISQAAVTSSTSSQTMSSSSPVVSLSARSELKSTSFSTNGLHSTSLSQSWSSQIPSQTPIADAQVTPPSHRPGIIAAIAASVVAVIIVGTLIFLLCRRRRIRQTTVGSSISEDPFMQESPRNEEVTAWKESASSTAGSGWPTDVSSWTTPPPRADQQHRQSVSSVAGKAPHYTLRSRASITDVYGFGQDAAWKEAHYEHPLPVIRPLDAEAATPLRPEIDVVPATPPSEIIHHNVPSATLLRSPSAASSVSSQYSTTSMVLPAPYVPPDSMVPDPSFIKQTSQDMEIDKSRTALFQGMPSIQDTRISKSDIPSRE